MDNRLYWGVYDTRPELHAIRYQPKLHVNGWKLLDWRTPLAIAGIALIGPQADPAYASHFSVLRSWQRGAAEAAISVI